MDRKESLLEPRGNEQFKKAKDPAAQKSALVGDKYGNRANQKELDEPSSNLGSPTLKVANPLEGYMASWMSAKDLQLFQTASKADEVVLSGITPLPDSTKLTFGHAASASIERAAPELSATNPYLLEVLPIASAPRLQLANPGKSSAATQSTTAVAAPESVTNLATTTSPTPPPDKLRPTDDARYFKQLKRF
jgi:hypothetical protein